MKNRTFILTLFLACLAEAVSKGMYWISNNVWVTGQENYSMKSFVSELPSLALALITVYVGRELLPKPKLGRKRLPFKLLSLLGGAVLTLILNAAVFNPNPEAPYSRSETFRNPNAAEAEHIQENGLTLGTARILWSAPIKEEVFYRFGLNSLAMGSINPLLSSILSSFVFTLSHASILKPKALVVIFFSGLIFSAVYFAYGLRYSILSHGLMNLVMVMHVTGFSTPAGKSGHAVTLSILVLFIVTAACYLSMLKEMMIPIKTVNKEIL